MLLNHFTLLIHAFDDRLKLLDFRIAACTGGSKFVLVNQIGHIQVNQISPLALDLLICSCSFRTSVPLVSIAMMD